MPGMRAPQVDRWTPLELVESTPAGEVFQNSIYQVRRLALDPTGSVAARADDLDGGLWIIVSRRDGGAVRDWRHLQRLKNQLAGSEREGIEIYPAESRLCDVGNATHLWLLPRGQVVPFGPLRRSVRDAGEIPGVAQRPFE